MSSQSDNPTKITIKTTTLEVSTPASHHHHGHRKRRPKELASPSSESRIHVINNDGPEPSSRRGGDGASNSVGNHAGPDSALERCSVTIQVSILEKLVFLRH